MKRLFLLVALFAFFGSMNAKPIKISVTPSDAKIYIDGNYQADGVTTANVRKKEGFIVVKVEKEGYITLEDKIFFTDKRKAVSYTMRRDVFFDLSVASGLVNQYFSVMVSEDLYTIDDNGKIDASLAWKMIHQIILNYMDEIKITDVASSYIQTPWYYKSFPEADKQVRTRVTVRESNSGADYLTFQIKISSEAANLIANREESFQEINRIIKDLEPMINEFQLRLGKP